MSLPSDVPVRGERAGGGVVLGKIASPPHRESTCDEFHFWVGRDALVERTQIVRTTCRLGGEPVIFYGLVKEVFRQGRPRDIAEACDAYDGDVDFDPPFTVPGITFATATILRTDPPVLAPPLEGSDVVLGGEEEAAIAYAADEIDGGKALPLGVIKNGGRDLAGAGRIDLDYLLGQNGGHINVNGVAGRGTKSSFLLHLIYMLLHHARSQQANRPSEDRALKLVPIILNVKNFDLFHIDRPSRNYDPAKHARDWDALGVHNPGPFQNVRFLAPQQRGKDTPVDTRQPNASPYSWALADVIREGLFLYLFADEDMEADNFEGIVRDVERRLTRTDRVGGTIQVRLNDDPEMPRDFKGLIDWCDAAFEGGAFAKHHTATRQKFQRKLQKVVYESGGVLRFDEPQGRPLNVKARETRDPVVVDISSLAATPALQRFVVAAILQQLVDERTGDNAVPNLKYLVMLDELNRFAPRGGKDPITRRIETVAAEMRSQGIILLGAQQQASLVSTRVFENAGIKALGKSGSMEMSRDIWRFLGETARRKAAVLDKTEKLLVQDSFREPMLVRIPQPPWAANPDEAGPMPLIDRVRDELDD